MGRILIIYETQTGCTEKMAQLVAEGAQRIEGMEVRVRDVEDKRAPDDALWADGIAVGTPTNLGGISWRMKRFWDDWSADNWSKVDGKICCSFSSQGGNGGGAELACTAMNIVLMNFGFLVFGVTDYIDKLNTLHYGACVAKEPRSEVSKDVCRRLGLRLAEWIAVYVDNKPELHPLLTTKKVEASGAVVQEEGKGVPAETTAPAAAAAPKPHTVKPTTDEPMPKGRVHLIVRMSVPVRNQIAFTAMARELTKHSRAEPGCLQYSFAKIHGSETEYFVVEEYTSVEALEVHSNSEHFKRLVPAMGKLSSTSSVEKAFPLFPQPVQASRCSSVKLAAAVALGALGAVAATRFLRQ